MKDFFSSHDINLGVIRLICTNGCPAILGHCSGFATLVQAEVPGIKVTHCVLHRYALTAKTLPPGLKEIMGKCVKVVNVIRSHALNHRIFKVLCESVGQKHMMLLYRTEVR